MAWDMRIPRKDKALLAMALDSSTSEHPQYDREATKKFIRLARSIYSETTIYFNDKKILSEAEFKGIVEAKPKHWDHLHVMPYRKGKE